MTSTTSSAESPGSFATTHWSVVVAAGQRDTPRAIAALEKLCRSYWYPLYAHVRRRGYSVEDAQDLTQEFFARLLDGRWLARADQARGRFRTFLLTALERFLVNEWHKDRALKRGAGQRPVPIQLEAAETRYGVEPADERTPEQAFEYRWALTLLEEVMRQLETEFLGAGQGDAFAALKPCLVVAPAPESYPALAARLGMEEGAVRVAVHRLRQRYRELLRAEIAHTVDSPGEIDAEMRHLYQVLVRR